MPRVAVGLAGFAAMMNMYAPQAVLPLLADEFGVGPAGISQIMTVNALAVAVTAPFTGVIADVAGRRRVIALAMALLVIPDLMMAFSPGLEALLFWRFVQGLLLPPIFAVSVAYIGSEWPADEATGVTGLFIAATAVGGFTGRMLIAALAEPIGWRHAFFSLRRDHRDLRGRDPRCCCRREEFRARDDDSRPRFGRCCGICANATACDLCGRLRHHVQFHRRLHLHRLRAGGAAVLAVADRDRAGFRGVSVEPLHHALYRLAGGAVRAAQFRTDGDCDVDLRHPADAGALRCRPSSAG